ncbi:MAG TPA: dTDP-4-dehydrorhamnose reductase [Dehalococcoidia bacterium]|nr:dTDP-4-dehydrorhamnose reductase [Dehalococcoidia bacterium]
MRIVITGAGGQLGRALSASLTDRHTIIPLTHQDCDVADVRAIDQIAGREPDLILHAAAMTHVDGAALDPDRAQRINGLGTRNVALAAQAQDVPLVYVSTNEVFDGRACTPYDELAETRPVNAYGASKLAGERYVQMLLRRYYIVRTAWVFGPGGNNFVSKILSLARGGAPLRLVTDEIGAPTYAPDLADAIGRLIEWPVYGIFHLTNQGVCSRYEYARRLLDAAGLADRPLEPIRLADFTRPSTPPPYTVLRNRCAADLGIELRPWQEALDEYLAGAWPELAG